MKQLTAVLADDDIDLLDTLCEFLEIYDFRVVGKAQDGKKAAQLYKKFLPNIIILDVVMPRFDGFYAIEKIQKINPNPIILVLTADTSSQTHRRLAEAGVFAIFYKGGNSNKLKNVLYSLQEKLEKQCLL